MITILASSDKSKCIIVLLFAITLFSIHPSKGQSITANSNSPLTLSINCPNNPQCVYSGENLSMNIVITNNTNQNLEIPLEAIPYCLMSDYFKNIRTGKIVGELVPPGMPLPELLKKLTIIPARSSKIIKVGYSKENLKKAFKQAHANQIIYYVDIANFIYFEGSKQPIGSYQNGKFEPKQFVFKTEKIITKQ